MTTTRPASSGRARSHIAGSTTLRARAVDERRPVVDLARLAGLERRADGGARSRAARRRSFVSGRSAASALAIPVKRPPPPQGTSTASTSGRSSSQLEPDRAVARHHEVVLHRMDEEPVEPVEARLDDRLPPALVRHLDDLAAEPRDRVELRLRRVLGDDDRRRDAELARGPRDALRHVAGARGDDALLAVASRGACRIALTAPRILNEPIGCRFSSLSQISAGASTCRRTSGVRIAAPRIVSRARSISASGIRSRPRCRGRVSRALATTSSAAARSSTAIPSDLKTRQLVRRRAARVGADQHLAELREDVLRADRALRGGEQVVAGLVQRRLAPVDEEARRGHGLACRARASSRMLEPTAFTCAPSASHSRRSDRLAARSCTCRRRRRRRAAPLRRCRRRSRRHVRISASRRGRRASPRRASAPARRRRGWRRRRASGRASARVATAETAAVRISVIGEAFRIARSCPSRRRGAAPRPDADRARASGLSGVIDDLLQRTRRAARRRAAPASVRSGCRRPGGRLTARSGWCSSPRASAREDPVHRLDALGHRQQLARRPPRTGSTTLTGRSCRSRRARVARGAARAPRAPARGAPAGAGRRRRPSPAGARAARRSRARRASSRARGARRLEGLERVEDASSLRGGGTGSGRIVIRDPCGSGSPRRYLPVSHPPASGLNGV